ncbi:hypothetical protein BDN70DRAFT_887130 [Pholiota conissans]|uniref:Uncharacterized protein n=1 Tax=Pholiota conissans TaxID=109636 RepID=A0A9P5YQY1_9AGAR|nr:hypothetical protein BDN70DRAFT_887130 [Pholiota conissans]
MPRDYLSSLADEMLDEISTFFGHGWYGSHPPIMMHDFAFFRDLHGDTLRPSFTQHDHDPYMSYRALAQTCKSFCAHFQPRLFSHLYLPLDSHMRKVAELIQDNPVLASYIRMIGLEVDRKGISLFEYPPLLAIMQAASSSGTPPRIILYIGTGYTAIYGRSREFISDTISHILTAPQIILHAVTHLDIADMPFSAGLFRLLCNLRVVWCYRFAAFSISNKSFSNRSAEDATPNFFCPKLDALKLYSCNPATIKMLCEQILDLSAVKELEVTFIEMGSNGKAYAKAKGLLARRLLDRAQSVQKLHLDIGVMVGPFYDLSRLQHLRECTLHVEVEAGTNPAPHLCQLLRTLPPLPEHDLEYLHLSFGFIDTLLDESDIAGSHVLFSISTWSNFDAALFDVVASGTRPFKLTLAFYIRMPDFYSVKPLLTDLFVNWGRNFLPRSSQQRNLEIIILHH